jgi:hypothetical protein
LIAALSDPLCLFKMTTITPKTVDELLDYWPGNIPFKGDLVSEDGSCMCAQGQALHFLDGVTSAALRHYTQTTADKRVAELFGISRAHSVLLRIVNDRQDGAPTSVIRNPQQVLGDQAQCVLAFWRHLDRMTAAAWEAAGEAAGEEARAAAGAAAGEAAWEAAWEAAGEAARAAAGAAAGETAWEAAGAAAREAAGAAAGETAWEAAGAAAREAARAAAGAAAGAAAWATNEIQGAAVMRAKGLPFFFLPLFGFADPEAVMAADSNLSRTA